MRHHDILSEVQEALWQKEELSHFEEFDRPFLQDLE